MKKTVSPNQRKALELIAAGNFVPGLVKEDDGWHARWFPLAGERTQDGIGLWLDEYVRAAAMTPLSADAEEQRYDTLHDAWINALKSRTGLVKWDDEECAVFARTLEAWTDREAFAARGGITFRLITEDEKLFVACDVPKGRAALKALGMAVYEWGKLRELRVKSEELRKAGDTVRLRKPGPAISTFSNGDIPFSNSNSKLLTIFAATSRGFILNFFANFSASLHW